MENIILKYLSETNQRRWDKTTVVELLDSNKLTEYVNSTLRENMKKYKTEQHDHQRDKQIYEQVNKHYKEISNGEL